VIDELAAVVRMEPRISKGNYSRLPSGEGISHTSEILRGRGDDLPLRYFINGVDVINTFDTVKVAPVCRVNPV
jgi:hypothetical protein